MPNQELQCPFCPKTSSRGTGLASHIRGAHPSQYAGWSRSRKGVTKARVQSSSKGTGITGGLKDAIEQLEAQRVAIERALAALREIDGIAPVAPAARRGRPPKAKRKGCLLYTSAILYWLRFRGRGSARAAPGHACHLEKEPRRENLRCRF